METRFKLLTWVDEDDCIFSREYKTEDEAIKMAQELKTRNFYPHKIISIFEIKKTGHSWLLEVWKENGSENMEYISFYSKKDAIFAKRIIEEYDDTIKTELTKIY